MTLQAKYMEREIIGEARGEARGEAKKELAMLLTILNNCKNVQLTASLTNENPAYIRKIAMENGLTDLVDVPQ